MDKLKIALILFLITILSVFYVYWGDNWLVEKNFRQKERNDQFMRNDLMQKLLRLEEQSQNLMKEITQLHYNLDVFPEKALAMSEAEELVFDNSITQKPVFDLKHLYIVTNNKLQVFDKDSFQLIWQKEIESNIIEIDLLDSNRLMLIQENSNVLCLDRDYGELLWQRKLRDIISKHSDDRAYQIKLNSYKKLDSRVVLLAGKNEIQLVDNITGSEIEIYKSEEDIDFISDYDHFFNCIYLVKNDKLQKLLIDKK